MSANAHENIIRTIHENNIQHLLIDDSDSVLEDHPELLGVINTLDTVRITINSYKGIPSVLEKLNPIIHR